MKYAVLQTGGKQYKVSEGSIIEVDKLPVEQDANVKFEKVLLLAQDGAFQLGQPHVGGALITAKVLEQKKGKKIRVAKFKAKARYRKVTGHRQHLTKLQIEKISVSKDKKESKTD
ncbi:MAG TPA: 50S ribosomal protein L21 [Candidatus Limnocylindrales bacterium]|nr:50S ribosomal protein L21 [Candidatus Limnocylindrales bacterium]